MRYNSLFFFFCFSFFLSNCNDAPKKTSPSKEQLIANYYLRYMQTDQSLLAQVSFFSADSSDIKHPKVFHTPVRFQNKEMETILLPKTTRYQSFIRGGFLENYEFQFIDKEKEKHTHQLKISPIVEFLVKDQRKVSKSNGMTLAWKGESLHKNESLLLMFIDTTSKTISIEIKGRTANIEVNISPEQLRELTLGAAELYLVRQKKEHYQEENILVKTRFEFYTKPLKVNVVK